MALIIKCELCEGELSDSGGLIFGPQHYPDASVEKIHLCVVCYDDVIEFILGEQARRADLLDE